MIKKQSSIIAFTLIAFILGGLFAYVFLMVNDPDMVSLETVNAWKWSILCPITLLLGLWMSTHAWLSGLSTITGTFIGACIAAVIHQSNIWPIAAIIWATLWVFPVLTGSLTGGVISWIVRRLMNK